MCESDLHPCSYHHYLLCQNRCLCSWECFSWLFPSPLWCAGDKGGNLDHTLVCEAADLMWCVCCRERENDGHRFSCWLQTLGGRDAKQLGNAVRMFVILHITSWSEPGHEVIMKMSWSAMFARPVWSICKKKKNQPLTSSLSIVCFINSRSKPGPLLIYQYISSPLLLSYLYKPREWQQWWLGQMLRMISVWDSSLYRHKLYNSFYKVIVETKQRQQKTKT